MTQIADAPARETALAYYVQELTEGRDPSALELAERFGRTDRWARNIRAEGAELFASTPTHQDQSPETEPVPADADPVPADAADETPAVDEATPEISAETGPIPAPENPAAVEQATEVGGDPENLTSFAQNQGQDAMTDLPRPSGHSSEPTATEAHTAAPSWTVQDPTITARPETVSTDAGTGLVPSAVPPAAPVVTAERDPEPVAPAGTLDASADADPEPAEAMVEHGAERGKVPGRFVAWLAFATGIGASVAANMLHAAEGGAQAAELIGAAFWPLALLLSIELLTRVTWPTGWLWGTGRFVGVGLVAVVAFVLSYRHMAGLLTSWGEDPLNAYLGPLAVDGLMLVAATALLAITRTRKNRP
ncbi:DUF2637 domain-containing protein [Kribbella sp. NPDC059898]|uniref:DUF2637 domain-containing protein n=1 Tax=Kribbella sp. NPDC059898 TaxID=3346995 RepID=UPI0036658C44